MARYIDADALEVVCFTDREGSFSDGVQWLLEYIDALPSADVVAVGFCKECDHYFPPLKAVVDGEVKDVTQPRCSRTCGFTQPNGWCYRFAQYGKSVFLDESGYIE